MRREFFFFSIIAVVAVGVWGWFWSPAFWVYAGLGPILALGIYDVLQTKHTLLRNYPLLGHGRYIMEELRPKIYQYFVESDTDGRPISRIFRSVVYQRAKKVLDSNPFGTQIDVYRIGYEWMHSRFGPP